jgi:hypothetical protein
MRTILLTLILLCLSRLVIGQNHLYDTIFTSNKNVVQISTKDLDSRHVLLYSTYDSRKALRDTIESEGLADIKFPDFNNDGNPDILLSYFGNNPTYYLYLFDPAMKTFKSIDGYMNFPDAIQLKSNPKYYYSYHRAGCADANWVSDLFKIVNFKIIQVGHIYGRGCDYETNKNPRIISIYKVPNNDEEKGKLIAKLPYEKYIVEFTDKWDFIKTYWNTNYGKFD